MSMIEKLTAVVEDVGLCSSGFGLVDPEGVVRAVLTALREPSEEIMSRLVALDRELECFESERATRWLVEGFIDAILNEASEPATSPPSL